MPACIIEQRPFEPPQTAKVRILAIDGGGIRGLVPAMLLVAAREPELAALAEALTTPPPGA